MQRSSSTAAPGLLQRPSRAPSIAPSVFSNRSIDRRLSAINSAEQGQDEATTSAEEAIHEEIDEIKRYEVRLCHRDEMVRETLLIQKE